MQKLAVLIVAAGVFCAAAHADEWTWQFNGDLNAVGGIGDPLMANGTTNFEAATIGGQPAQVARFLGPDGNFRVNTPVGPNGGGDYVNIYSLIMDVQFPETTWISMYQTNDANSNDGDAFIQNIGGGGGGIGISGDYDDAGNPLRFSYNEWHRVALVYDATNGGDEYIWYIDGQEQNVVQGDFTIDDRWSLYGDGNAFADWFYIFADENGDQADWGLVNSFQFRDVAMTAAEVRALGGATAAGIPEPGTLALLLAAVPLLLRRR